MVYKLLRKSCRKKQKKNFLPGAEKSSVLMALMMMLQKRSSKTLFKIKTEKPSFPAAVCLVLMDDPTDFWNAEKQLRY